MKLPYLVLLTIVSILLTLLHSYKNSNVLQYQSKCTITSICVICPQAQYSAKSHPLKKYTRVSHTQKFYVLSTSKDRIIEIDFVDLLQLIERKQMGVLALTQLMRQKIGNSSFSFQLAEQVSMASGTEYHSIISDKYNYYIFYEAFSYTSPRIYVQNEANSNRLMSLSRSITWGMLFALILKFIDRQVGICNPVGRYPFPLVESLILTYIIYISYQMSTFSYLYIAYLMFLLYLLMTLVKAPKIINFAIFMVVVVFVAIGELYLFLANLLWLVFMKKIYDNLFKQSLKIKISSIIVIMGLVIEVLVLLSQFNFFIYLSYAFKVISVAVSFMMFQVEDEVDINPKKKQIIWADKWIND